MKKPRSNKTKKIKKDLIQHHHFLLRMETKHCPLSDDKYKTEKMVKKIISEIGMKALDQPHVYYVKQPKYNEGLTAIVPIETSHIAFHFWRWPDKKILFSPESHCLLEFDIYTCGNFTQGQMVKVLENLSEFEPTHVDITRLNRKWSLSIDYVNKWDISESSWSSFLKNITPTRGK